MIFPSGRTLRYFWPSVHSMNFALMPNRPAAIIHSTAPGPPMPTATATPAMLPSPTVADRAAVRAWKWLTSPASFGSSYFPAVTRIACLNARKLMNPV